MENSTKVPYVVVTGSAKVKNRRVGINLFMHIHVCVLYIHVPVPVSVRRGGKYFITPHIIVKYRVPGYM